MAKKPHDGKCGKKNRQGLPCSMPAGWGTDHKGKGACKLHGGATPIKHGLYSKYAEHTLGKRIVELLEDPDLLDLKRPVALVQALMEKLLADAAAAGTIDQDTRDSLTKLANQEGSAIERYYRTTEGTKHTIRVENVQVFLTQVAVIINEEVGDAALRSRIAERLGTIRIIPD